MSSPSAVPGLIDRLVAIFDAAVAVTVYDGPEITDANKQSYVAVGWNGALDDAGMPDAGTVASIDQPWAAIGALAKDEIADITCGAVAWNGGRKFKPVRDLAWDYVSDCEQALRTALRPVPSGGDAALQALVQWCGIAAGSYDQTNETDAVKARVEFTVRYQARI
jgi:hypothetical protein